MSPPRRAGIVGIGLIGGSVGMALRRAGWHVTGRDVEPTTERAALAAGAVDVIGVDAAAEITFIATPVGQVAAIADEILDASDGLVTDVGSVKGPLLDALSHPRFVGGHPMAGSEQDGIAGARADLFDGATWVLTPIDGTDDASFALVRQIVSMTGADVVTIAPDRHDALVAVVSHVPHLTAATLMALADDRAVDNRSLLRLAAGGFRDMTRIASGRPGIWPDICAENADAIVDVLDELLGRLGDMRDIVADARRPELLALLEGARHARQNLPGRASRPENLAEVRVPIPDREGEVAKITGLAAEHQVNIFDLDIAHSSEGDRGVLILVVDAPMSAVLHDALVADDYRPSVNPLS